MRRTSHRLNFTDETKKEASLTYLMASSEEVVFSNTVHDHRGRRSFQKRDALVVEIPFSPTSSTDARPVRCGRRGSKHMVPYLDTLPQKGLSSFQISKCFFCSILGALRTEAADVLDKSRDREIIIRVSFQLR